MVVKDLFQLKFSRKKPTIYNLKKIRKNFTFIPKKSAKINSWPNAKVRKILLPVKKMSAKIIIHRVVVNFVDVFLAIKAIAVECIMNKAEEYIK